MGTFHVEPKTKQALVSNGEAVKLRWKLSEERRLTVSMGVVSSPQAKNSRKMTTTAWYTLGFPIPCCIWGGKEKDNKIKKIAPSCIVPTIIK